MDRLASGAEKLSSILSRSGDDFISKLAQALRLAIDVAKTIRRAEGSGGFDFGDVLNIAGDVLGIGALFDRGGFTGAGSTNSPAGTVHRGEYVFEKSLVDKYGRQIEMMHSMMRSGRGYAGGGSVAGGGGTSSPMSVTVVLEGTLEGQRFLRKEMPSYDTYKTKKTV